MATHTLHGTQKQISYARKIAARQHLVPPWGVQMDRARLSEWISARAGLAPVRDTTPSSKQVALAERLARRRHVDIPAECFRDRGLMSRWIDHNRV